MRSARVLVVDDDGALAETLRAVMCPEYLVDVAGSPDEALAHLSGAEGYDLVLCDVNMPRMTGPQLHDVVERRRPEMAVRFVFMTSDASEPGELHGQPVLTKPIEDSTLHGVVTDCLHTPRGERPAFIHAPDRWDGP